MFLWFKKVRKPYTACESLDSPRSSTSSVVAVWLFTAALFLMRPPQPASASDENLVVDLNPRDGYGTINCMCRCFDNWWIGSDKGLYRVNIPETGKVIAATIEERLLEFGSVTSLCDFNGSLWIGSTNGLFRCEPGKSRGRITKVDPNVVIDTAAILRLHSCGGYLWIGFASAGVYRWKGDSRTKAVPVTGRVTVTSFNESDTDLWISTAWSLYRWKKNSGDERPEETLDTIVYCTHLIRDVLWFGGHPSGIFSWHPGPRRDFQLIREDTGQVHQFLRAGSILWIAADTGLYSWREGSTIPNPVGLQTDKVAALYRAPNKEQVWIIARNGLFRLDGVDDRSWKADIHFTKPTSARVVEDENLLIGWDIGNYGWRTTPDLVQWRIKVTGLATEHPEHVSDWKKGPPFEYTVPPLEKNKGPYKLEVEATDLQGDTATAAFHDPIAVSARLPEWLPYVVWGSFGMLAAVLASVSWMLADPGRVRWLYQKIGYEYVLNGSDSPRIFELSGTGSNQAKLKDKSATSGANKYEGDIILSPPAFAPNSSPPIFDRGDDVQLEIDENETRVPISESWRDTIMPEAPGLSAGRDAVVIGQRLIVHKPQPPVTGSLALAVLSSGEDPFRDARGILAPIVKTALSLKLGIAGYKETASPEDFHSALIQANIVFLQAHGKQGYVQFSRGGRYDLQNLRKLPLNIRCRLLVLASCKVGKGGGDESLIRGLQSRDINVVASTIDVNFRVIASFMRMVLEEFLKAPAFDPEGKTLATSLREAAIYYCNSPKEKFNLTTDQLKVELDSYVLYGKPRLHIERALKRMICTECGRRVNWAYCPFCQTPTTAIVF